MNPAAEAPAPPAPPLGKAMDHVIPTRNQPALMGYYCAIFGLIPVAGLFLGPAAIGYGLLGLERGAHLPRRIGYGHALFATVAGIVGTVFNYALLAALAVTLTFSYLNATWPFPPEQPIPEILEDHQRQIDALQNQLESMRKGAVRPGRNLD
jgi:hypothetical protein